MESTQNKAIWHLKEFDKDYTLRIQRIKSEMTGRHALIKNYDWETTKDKVIDDLCEKIIKVKEYFNDQHESVSDDELIKHVPTNHIYKIMEKDGVKFLCYALKNYFDPTYFLTVAFVFGKIEYDPISS